MRRRIPVLVLLLVSCAGAVHAGDLQAAAAAGGECSGGRHVVAVEGDLFFGTGDEYTEIVLERSTVGLCEPAVVLVDAALPFVAETAHPEHITFAATFELDAPREGVMYRYRPLLRRAADGELETVFHSCDADFRSYGLVGCGEALLDRVVDIFGDRSYCTMPGGPYHVVTGMRLAADDGCGPVPAVPTNWGSLKARFR